MVKAFSFWTGPITWMERASAVSMARQGVDLTVYSYETITIPAKVGDARKVLDDPSVDWLLRERTNHWADIFRVEGIAQDCGVWLDLDQIILQPLPKSSYLIGESIQGVVNGVLGMPAESPALKEYLGYVRRRPVPRVAPWLPWGRRLAGHVNRTRKLISGMRPPRPVLGPPAIQHLVSRYNLPIFPVEVFYPIDIRDLDDLNSPGPDARWRMEQAITPRTVAVHLFNEQYSRRFGRDKPHPDSWLGRMLTQLGVEADAAQPVASEV